MKITETILEGCVILEPKIFCDDRGFFFESFNKQIFQECLGGEIDFVQDNQSVSKRGVIRGLHYQQGEYAQAKLVRVLKGRVLDVAVDLRMDSSTFGQYISVELSSENRKQLFVPRGFAHGFVVLSDIAEFFYKCDNYYNKASEGGLIYNDPDLNIDWKINEDEIILSEKDALLPSFKDAMKLELI